MDKSFTLVEREILESDAALTLGGTGRSLLVDLIVDLKASAGLYDFNGATPSMKFSCSRVRWADRDTISKWLSVLAEKGFIDIVKEPNFGCKEIRWSNRWRDYEMTPTERKRLERRRCDAEKRNPFLRAENSRPVVSSRAEESGTNCAEEFGTERAEESSTTNTDSIQINNTTPSHEVTPDQEELSGTGAGDGDFSGSEEREPEVALAEAKPTGVSSDIEDVVDGSKSHTPSEEALATRLNDLEAKHADAKSRSDARGDLLKEEDNRYREVVKAEPEDRGVLCEEHHVRLRKIGARCGQAYRRECDIALCMKALSGQEARCPECRESHSTAIRPHHEQEDRHKLCIACRDNPVKALNRLFVELECKAGPNGLDGDAFLVDATPILAKALSGTHKKATEDVLRGLREFGWGRYKEAAKDAREDSNVHAPWHFGVISARVGHIAAKKKVAAGSNSGSRAGKVRTTGGYYQDAG